MRGSCGSVAVVTEQANAWRHWGRPVLDVGRLPPRTPPPLHGEKTGNRRVTEFPGGSGPGVRTRLAPPFLLRFFWPLFLLLKWVQSPVSGTAFSPDHTGAIGLSERTRLTLYLPQPCGGGGGAKACVRLKTVFEAPSRRTPLSSVLPTPEPSHFPSPYNQPPSPFVRFPFLFPSWTLVCV